MEVKAWYFDAWAVYDGLAFSSKRAPEGIDSSQTVFLSVPDLEPVPIGRISTALLAQRFNFQRGFRDENGEEIAFSSLAELRECVRRGYLGGGIGPEPGAEPALPVVPIEPGTPGSPAVEPGLRGPLYDNFVESRQHEAPANEFQTLADPAKRTPFIQSLQSHAFTKRVWPFLSTFARATIAKWSPTLGQYIDADAQRGAFHDWVSALSRMQMWEFQEIPELISYSLLSEELVELFEDAIHAGMTRPAGAPREVKHSTLYYVPCPLRKNWHQGIRTINDKLLLALTTSGYFENNSALPELIPSLLAAMYQVVNHLPDWTRRSPRPDASPWRSREKILFAALNWLDRELPQMLLPFAAEVALERFAWGQLPSP